jgi:putative peptidoglycan lipid II flippase
MGSVLIAFLVGLIPFTILFVLLRSFYALEDTRTPFFIQVAQSAIFVAGALVVSLLPPESIAVGIGWVTTIAGTFQALLAAVLLRRRLGSLDGRHVVRQYLVYSLAALPAAAAGVALVRALGGFTGGFAVSGIVPAVLSMALVGGVMLLIYLAVLVALRNPELRAFVTPVTSRLRGRR